VTYTEKQPPVVISRDEVRQIAKLAAAILDGDSKTADLSEATRKVLHANLVEDAKDVMTWCDGTLLSGENDADVRVVRMVPMTFGVTGYYANDLAERLDMTPDAVLKANPVYVAMLRQLAGFIDAEFCGAPAYSTEARLEALGNYDLIMARLMRATNEYIAELPDLPDHSEPSQDGEIETDETQFERSTNHGAYHI
jgi:hypothetical protein